ncbi:MAG: hypothetical protein PWP08_544 [Methanofollis sp.]|nr:hypothetical protein [Methanofollis sp.]
MIRPGTNLVLILLLAAAILVVPVLAVNATTNGTTDGTTELHIVKYADDRKTVLNETTVDYHWLEENLPVHGDGVTRYYHQGPVFDGVWEDVHPDEPYDGWNPAEDVQMSILYKGDFGAVMGTDLKDICEYIGGASPGDTIDVCARDGYDKTFPYSIIYAPDPRQGPAVLCWFSGNGSGPDMQEGKEQGEGYPDTGYIAGMRLIFFADTSTNPWGWHVFGNNDMKECWDEDSWNYGGQYPSAAGTSPMWVDEVRIYSQESPEPPVAAFTASSTSGTMPFTVTFTDASTGNPTSWAWDFGDSGTSDEQHPVHTYTTAGVYTVNLTVTNAVGSNSTEKRGYITTFSSSGGDGGDGGGDSGSTNIVPVNTTAPSTNSTEQSNQTTAALQSLTFQFEGSDIDEIVVSGQFDPASLNISCEKTALPGTVPAAPGTAYAYYTITCDDANATIDTARIRFSVPETWVLENEIGLSGLLLYRYDRGWTPLVTTRTGAANGSITCEAAASGFSLFAISGKHTVSADVVTIPPMKVNSSSKPTTQAADREPETGNPILILVGVLVVLACAAGVAYWYLRLRKKDDGNKEEPK